VYLVILHCFVILLGARQYAFSCLVSTMDTEVASHAVALSHDNTNQSKTSINDVILITFTVRSVQNCNTNLQEV